MEACIHVEVEQRLGEVVPDVEEVDPAVSSRERVIWSRYVCHLP